ncbi:MAG: hypothetical protein RIC14_08395 [Filomicrobium sp.]
MPITPLNADSATKVVAIWQTLFGTAPPSEAFLNRQIILYERDPDNYLDIVYRSRVFQNEFANDRGVVPEINLIKVMHANLGLSFPPLANMRLWSNRFDGGDLLEFVYSRPWIQQTAEHAASDFVTKLIDGDEVAFGESLFNQPEQPVNEAPTGINMTDLGDVSEDLAAGSNVATLEAIDPDADDTHVFTIVNDDDVPFTVAGDNMIVYQGGDVENDTDFVLQVMVEDSAGNEGGPFAVTVTVTNEDPVDPIEVGSGEPGTAGDDLFVGDEDSLPGASIDGGEGNDTLKVIVNLNFDPGDSGESRAQLNIYDDHFGDFNIDGRYVGAFHAKDIETLDVKVFGFYDEDDVIIDAAGMPDLEKIVIDGSQAELPVAIANINEADGLEIELSHSITTDFVFDFKKGLTQGTETVQVTVDHIGAIEDSSDKEDDGKSKTETKGGNLIFTEAGTTPEHGKLANLEQVDLVFEGDPSAIGSIISGVVKDEYGDVVDGLETITGTGDAKVVIGYEAPLIEFNKYLQTIDMSGTTADNEYVVGWGDDYWKVPVYEYDEYGKKSLVEKLPLTFLGGSGDETIFLPNGLFNATINGGDGFDTVILEDLPVGKDNSFDGIELVKIVSPVGSDDPWNPDMLDMGVLAGVTNVELSCGINCYDYLSTYEEGFDVEKQLRSLSQQLDGNLFSFLDMKNLASDTEYTLTIAPSGEHSSGRSSEGKKDEPADLGDFKDPDPQGLDGKVLVLDIDVGEEDTETTPQAGNGTNDVFNLVLEDDIDVFLTASETEELNVTAATKYGDGGHTIYFGKRDVEKTLEPVDQNYDGEIDDDDLVQNEHYEDVLEFDEVNNEKDIDIAEDLTTINLDGEADFIELASAKPELTPNLETIDASALEGATRLVVSKGFGSNADTGLTVIATDNDDIVYGTNNGDTLIMNGGMDYANGLGGDDTILGGDDMDNLIGGGGADLVNGGAGADWMTGGGDTATIREIVIEGKIGDGDTYTVIIDAHGEEIPVETTFRLDKFYIWTKLKWENEDNVSYSNSDFYDRLWSLDADEKEHLKLQHLQKEMAYNINYKLYAHDLGGEMYSEVDEHGRLVVVKESGFDFELIGFAVDGHGIEDHPEMATFTIEPGNYDYGDKVIIKLEKGYYYYYDSEELYVKVDDSLDTNDDGVVDQNEVAEALAEKINSHSNLADSAEVIGDGDTVKLTSHEYAFRIDTDGGTKVVDARAHISFSDVHGIVAFKLNNGEDPFGLNLFDLSGLYGSPSGADIAVVGQIVSDLGFNWDPGLTFAYKEGKDAYYVFKDNQGETVATVKVDHLYRDKFDLEIYGPKDGSPFPDTPLANSAMLIKEAGDDSGDEDIVIMPELWTDVTDNKDPWIENVIEDTSEGIDAGGLIQAGDPDDSDTFVVSEEDPDPGVDHHNDFVEGSEEDLIDTIKDFVTAYAEKHYEDDPKANVIADKIDFEGIDVDGVGNFVDASVEAGTQENPVVFANYAEALDEAQDEFLLFALQNGGLTEGYAAASYMDGGEVATAVFSFQDDGDFLADSGVKLVGIGPGEVTEDDIIGDFMTV